MATTTMTLTPEMALVEAQRQIEDLQAQVRLLNEKAAAAVDRWADYEDELAKLRSALSKQQQQDQESASPSPPAPATAATPSRTSLTGAASRISALLSPRRSTPGLQQAQSNGVFPSSGSNPLLTATTPNVEELLAALSREQALRQEAEAHVARSAQEVEELTAKLFEEANEMVARERRARAALEERVVLLEKRELDKRRRLEKLEGAMQRINKVRGLLVMQKNDQVSAAAQPSDLEQVQDQQKEQDEAEAQIDQQTGQKQEPVQEDEQASQQENEYEKEQELAAADSVDSVVAEEKGENPTSAGPTSSASPARPASPASPRAPNRSTSLRKWLASRPFSGEKQG